MYSHGYANAYCNRHANDDPYADTHGAAGTVAPLLAADFAVGETRAIPNFVTVGVVFEDGCVASAALFIQLLVQFYLVF